MNNDIKFCAANCENIDCKRHSRDRILKETTSSEMLQELGYERNQENEEAYYRHGGICKEFESWVDGSNDYELCFYFDNKTFAKFQDYGEFEPVTIPELQAILQKFSERGVNI